MSGHTPGPWRIAGRENASTIAIWAGGDYVTGVAYIHAPKDDAECDANARLIAAAPELLEMVRYVYDTLGTGAPLYNTAQLHTRLCELLAKVEPEAVQP